MPKKCAFGFSCAAMLMQPGLIANDCPNSDTCGTLPDLPEDRPINFYRIREIDGQRTREVIALTNSQAARMMLLYRGCPQSPQSLGAIAALDNLQATLEDVRSRLSEYDNTIYIAPINSEAHAYNVKRPTGTYQYNKLAANDAIFEPSERSEKVKVIHLSSDGDPRDIEARAGIERRNKILNLVAKLDWVHQSMHEVLANL